MRRLPEKQRGSGRRDGRKDIFHIVMFYVVAPYDTGGVTNVSESHADSSSASMSLDGGRDQSGQTESKVK